MRSFAEAGRVLGSLEERIMDVLWAAERAVSVREVCRQLRGRPALAYTTVMTTLDRLYRKGLLSREKDGNAFRYLAAMSRDEVHRRIVEETVTGLLEQGADPVLAAFVDTAASVDEDNLERLEQLIAQRRRSRR
jgi:predicted transcriptional regulator